MLDTRAKELLALGQNQHHTRLVDRLFETYDEFVAFFDRVHKLAGGRGQGFAVYEQGVPTPWPSGWFTHARLMSQVFADAEDLRLTREHLAAFTYLQAGFLNDPEHTPVLESAWKRVKPVPADYLAEVFADDHVAPRILQYAASLFDAGIPADYARNIAGGIAERSAFDRQGDRGGIANGYNDLSIIKLHTSGVPWKYANVFSEHRPWDRGNAPATHLKERPWTTDIIRFFQEGVDAAYANTAHQAGVGVSRIIEGWKNSIPIEYLTA